MTRIALPVPSRADSMVILDRAGAESIAKTPGRLLVSHGARVIETQAFDATDAIAHLPGGIEQFNARTKSLTSAHLSDREMRLAHAALERDGWFRVREIAEATGESRDWVNDVAKKCQVLGSLTDVQRNTSGHQVGRRNTPNLSALLGANGSSGQAD